jgi:hypothetical protein
MLPPMKQQQLRLWMIEIIILLRMWTSSSSYYYDWRLIISQRLARFWFVIMISATFRGVLELFWSSNDNSTLLVPTYVREAYLFLPPTRQPSNITRFFKNHYNTHHPEPGIISFSLAKRNGDASTKTTTTPR